MYVYISFQVLNEMVRQDLLYANHSRSKLSLKRLDGYLTFSEAMQKHFPGYVLKNRAIVAKTDHAIDMDDLLALLRSKDISRYES